MKSITTPVAEQLDPESQILLEQIKKRVGKIPNLYATIGYSANALKGFLDFEATLNKGVFDPKEREAIALVVSEVNHCEYCLAAHTMLAVKSGLEMDETLDIRKGNIRNEKFNTVIQLAKSIVQTMGNPAPELVDKFFNAGYNETALMDLIGLITVRVFTNYVFAITHIPVDFAAAPPLV